METTETETYMNITEAARYVALSRPMIYKLEKSGRLPISRLIPDAPRVRKSDLDALLATAFNAELSGAGQGGMVEEGDTEDRAFLDAPASKP